MRQGTLLWFDSENRFGLIAPDDGSADVFVDPFAIKSKGYRTLQQNERVEFSTRQDSRNRWAEIVVPIGDYPPQVPGPAAGMVLPGVPLKAGDPDVIGQYAILRRLGQGTMGIVYLARGPDGKTIALKVVRPEWADEAEFLRRFTQEVTHASRVDAPYAAKVLASGTDASHPYLAVEFIDGPTLEAEVTLNGPLSLSWARAVAIGTAAALIAIHEAGIVHRDLKPSNVLLSRSGPQVIDFGIARSLGATTRFTQVGSRVGAPAYMSPEQIEDANLTPASDVFSWAGMIVYAATGHQPFGGPDTHIVALYRKVVEGQPNLAEVPVELHAILEAAFAKEATARPTPRDLLAFLTGSSRVVGDPSKLADRAIRKVLKLPPPATIIPSGTTMDEEPSKHKIPHVSPFAQKLAAEAGVDLATVVGTGRHGLIRKSDITQAVAARRKQRSRETPIEVMDTVATRYLPNPLPPWTSNPSSSKLCPVIMPPLGDAILYGTVYRWLKKERDHVWADEPLVEVSSDMIDCEVPSPASGILRSIAIDEDETVPISWPLAVIEVWPAEQSSGERRSSDELWSWQGRLYAAQRISMHLRNARSSAEE